MLMPHMVKIGGGEVAKTVSCTVWENVAHIITHPFTTTAHTLGDLHTGPM